MIPNDSSKGGDEENTGEESANSGMSNCSLSWRPTFCLLSFPFSDQSPYTHKPFKGSLIKLPQTFIYKSR